ncbi:MAG: hypothetical protein JO236_01535 [Mycobacterium sp.]|uniref:hypothetical protein n=1 Tax=Mycobacterium sp. TaxID=1785 RepID=UPI001EC1E591|nr:hypothetical protein [Mycobacterium sp.]MBW0016222.1 hypothetical protein [Mycobacterium sp.]
MRDGRARTALALCAGAAVLTSVIGFSATPSPTGAPIASTPPSSVAPAPDPGDPRGGGGALPVRPAGGGACIVGLNCGCIPRLTCPSPHPRAGGANGASHAPGPPAP